MTGHAASAGVMTAVVSGRNGAARAAARAALARSLLGQARPASWLWPMDPSGPPRLQLFGLAIENARLSEAARELAAAARDRRRMRIVFANAHVINVLHESAAYRATVRRADRIYADGSGMALAARIAGASLGDNVNGTDLFPLLCREAIAAGTTIFLIGGKPGVAAAAAATIADFGMGASIAGTHHGYFRRDSEDEDRVIGKINASGAGIVLVGFGVPLQDQWAERIANRLDAPVIGGVGGLFDFFSGAVSRAPKLMRTVGCEWLWRLAMEPRRMAYRYLVGNATFIGHALDERSGQRAARGLDALPAQAFRVPALGRAAAERM